MHPVRLATLFSLVLDHVGAMLHQMDWTRGNGTKKFWRDPFKIDLNTKLRYRDPHQIAAEVSNALLVQLLLAHSKQLHHVSFKANTRIFMSFTMLGPAACCLSPFEASKLTQILFLFSSFQVPLESLLTTILKVIVLHALQLRISRWRLFHDEGVQYHLLHPPLLQMVSTQISSTSFLRPSCKLVSFQCSFFFSSSTCIQKA